MPVNITSYSCHVESVKLKSYMKYYMNIRKRKKLCSPLQFTLKLQEMVKRLLIVGESCVIVALLLSWCSHSVYLCICCMCAQSHEKKAVRVQADDPVSFLQLTSKNDLGTTEVGCIKRHCEFAVC